MTKAKATEGAKGSNDRMVSLVLRQMSDGTTIVSRSSGSSRQKSSRAENAHQQRFQKAARYARWAAKVHPIYAQLSAGTRKTPYNLARSDWFNPPVIHEVRFTEDKIRVQASDNVTVTKVVITILDEQGKLLEAGEATRQEEDWWEYTPTIMGKTIIVEAWDLPGNVAKFVL
jgi:hypothetical protein